MLSVIAGQVIAKAGNLQASVPVGAQIVIESVGQGHTIENTPASTAPITINGTAIQPGTLNDDNDNDGYLTTREGFQGTNPNAGCAATSAPDDEAIDPNPRDLNDDGRITLSDVLRFSPSFGKAHPDPAYNRRVDLNADNRVSLSDVLQLSSVFNSSCLP